MTNPTHFTSTETRKLLADAKVVAYAAKAYPEARRAVAVWSSSANDRHRQAVRRLEQQRAAVVAAGTPRNLRAKVLHLIRVSVVDVHYSDLGYLGVQAALGVDSVSRG